jgi:hypothetical protein
VLSIKYKVTLRLEPGFKPPMQYVIWPVRAV